MLLNSLTSLFKNQKLFKEKVQEEAPPALELVRHRYEFYRDQYRLLLKTAFIQSCVLAASLGISFYLILRPSDAYFFATTREGRLIPLAPLDRPNLEPSAVLSWANRAVVETFTFGFHDRRMRHQAIRKYFTPSGWESFQVALEDARIIEMIEKQSLVVTAVPKKAPVVVEEGLSPERKYFWVIQVPVVVTYQGSSKSSSSSLLITVRLERTSVLDEGEGLGITQWMAAHEA